MTSDHGSVAAVHNLDDDAAATLEPATQPHALFGEAEFETTGNVNTGKWGFEMDRYGYCWVRVEEER